MRHKIVFFFLLAYVGLCIGAGLAGLAGCGRLQGTPGADGKSIQGDTGEQGLAGNSCSVTSSAGGALITCEDGSSAFISDGTPGANGNDGADGSDGADGADGNDGAPGQDATPIQMVQFCPGATTYPSSFPEYGVCVQDRLYAVFWMGGKAWLAEVVPGTYISTSSSVSCSFTVGAACEVIYD